MPRSAQAGLSGPVAPPRRPALAPFGVARSLPLVLLLLGVACAPVEQPDMPLSAMNAGDPVQPQDVAGQTATGDADVAPPAPAKAVTGRGFAQVSGQPGGTISEKRLMAIRAARLEALRDLAEQVHGAGLASQTVLRDSVVVDDEVRARLTVALRGARTVSILPMGEDGYEVVMQLDPAGLALVNRILRASP